MIDFLCDLLGVAFSSLSIPLQTIITICASVIILVFLDCIVRFFVAPVFALMNRFNNK